VEIQRWVWNSRDDCGNPESREGCDFPEVSVDFQRWVWISRGHKADKASAAFLYVHKISIYTNEQKYSCDALTGTCKQDQSGSFPSKQACTQADAPPHQLLIRAKCRATVGSRTGQPFVDTSSLDVSSLVTIAAGRTQAKPRATAILSTSASQCRRYHHPSRQNTFASLRPTATALSRAAGPFPRRRSAKRIVPRA
jgi:hypothetical protein